MTHDDETIRRGDAVKALRDWQDNLNKQRLPITATAAGRAADMVAALPAATVAVAVKPDAVLDFRLGSELPCTPAGTARSFIVTVRRAGKDKTFTFPAVYLNAYPLEWDGGDGCGECPEDGSHEDGCPITMWATDRFHPDYDSYYEHLLNKGDTLLEWAALPDRSIAATVTVHPAPDVAQIRADALREAGDLIHRIANGYYAGGDGAIACALFLTEGNIRSLIDTPPTPDAVAERVAALVEAAYTQGATDVHNNWQADKSPDFSEAARDYRIAAMKGGE